MLIFILFIGFWATVSSQKLPTGPLTEDFQNWLISNGYERDAFDRSDVGPSGSFGGRLRTTDKVWFLIFFFNSKKENYFKDS